MKAENFIEKVKQLGISTIVGVPDSTLKQFCDYINSDGKEEMTHMVPPNEGAAIGIATGVFLSTNKPACVYMQNSGLGNIVNPITSLANEKVYDIPMLLVIGWRGEPGFHDEPQHKFMGEITEGLLDVLDIEHSIISKDTSESELTEISSVASNKLSSNKQYAIIVKKDTFEKRKGGNYQNKYELVREDAIKVILGSLKKEDIVISTTGKISREVYEESDIVCGQHYQDFLTVGGMGHASMIALGVAKNKPSKKVFCIDGDGAVLMHMGSLAFIGKQSPKNLIHICINNEAHESVGGMPTGATGQDYSKVADACGYKKVFCVETESSLLETLKQLDNLEGPVFIEIKVSMSSREDLGRPKESAIENKINFMKYHNVTEN